MECKFRNAGEAVRIIYDIGGVSRTVRPGQEVTFEVSQTQARKYEKAEADGTHGGLECTPLAEYDDKVDAKEKAYVLPTQRADKEQHSDQPRLDPNFTVREGDDMRARTIKESNQGSKMPQRRPQPGQGEGMDDLGDVGGLEGVTGAKGKDAAEGDKVERVKIRPDRIKHEGDKIGREAKPTAKPKGKPLTAVDLLARVEDFNEKQLLENAERVLKKGTLPIRPKHSQIVAALRKQAQAESRAVEKAAAKAS